MDWTPEQEKIINFKDGNLLVSASAGCGKTTVMLGRVMRLLADGYSLKRMLISTFTVSAADDMRTKLATKLRDALQKTGDKRFADELDYLPNADICTLHKWCIKTIRKYFYVTGDDPAFEIADENECTLWRKQAIDKAVEELEESGNELYYKVSPKYTRKRGNKKIKEIVHGVMIFVDAQTDADEWLKNACNCYKDTSPCLTFLDNYISRRVNVLDNALTEIEMEAKQLELDKAPIYIAELREFLHGANVNFSRMNGVKPIKDKLDDIKKRIQKVAKFRENISNARNEEAKEAAELFVAIAIRARELYAEMKLEKGKFDFADLERKAKLILQSDEGEEIRKSLDYVFIDEYQDINPLQESIIKLIGRDNLFFVGDIKQSIYAFRNCTPDAFAAKREELKTTKALFELNKNYRSKAGILKFTNLLFSRIMTEGFGKVDYKSVAQFDLSGEDCNDDSVEIVSVPCIEDKDNKCTFDEIYSVRNNADVSQITQETIEAEKVVRKIISELETGKKYEDIVVLVRSRSVLATQIARTLRAVGVPVSISEKPNINEGRCNKLLISYLRLLNNFEDDVSLAAVMRSVIGGFSDGELAELRAKDRKSYFWKCVLNNAETNEKIAAFLEEVKEYAKLSGLMPVGELAGKITSEKKLFSAALSEPLGVAKADALGRLLENAKGFNGTLSEYLEYIDESVECKEAAQASGSVRIMTIHSSKGLEFNTVILCGLSRQFRTNEKSRELTDSEFGLCIESRVEETGEKELSLPLIAAKIKDRLSAMEEEMRVLYVALTRAMEKLVIFLIDKENKSDLAEEANSYFDWLIPSAVAHGRVKQEEGGGDIKAETEEAEVRLDTAILDKLCSELNKKPVVNVGEIKKSVTALLAGEHTRLDDNPRERLNASLAAPEYDQKEAMKRGTAYHAAMEKLDFNRPIDEQWESVADIEDYELTDKQKLMTAHDTMSEELQGADLYKEQPFIYAASKAVSGENDGMMMQGVIDLMAVWGNRAVIYDYKTGRLTEEKKAQYSKQLAIYAEAVEKVLGLSVTAKKLYLIDEEKLIEV